MGIKIPKSGGLPDKYGKDKRMRRFILNRVTVKNYVLFAQLRRHEISLAIMKAAPARRCL